MTFLKKLGQILATVTATAIGIGPLVGPLFGGGGSKATTVIGTVTNDLTAVGTVIAQIETALQGKTGADKLAAAIALVGPIITTSQMVSGKKIADAAAFQKGVTEVTQGVVDILNSLDPDSVKTEVHT
jgi:hypothetical protein